MAKAKNLSSVTKQSLSQMSDKTVREYFWALIQETKRLSDDVGGIKRSLEDGVADAQKLREQLVANEVISDDEALPSGVEVADDTEVRPDVVQRRNRGEFRKPTV
jgi:hypothetical protein